MKDTKFTEWRNEYKRRLVSAEEAVKVVKSGDRIVIPLMGEPRLLPKALLKRKGEVENIEILANCPEQQEWFDPDDVFKLNVEVSIRGSFLRKLITERKASFTPNLMWLWMKGIDEPFRREKNRDIDVVMTVVSPPDENGFCSFGESLWSKKDYILRAKTVIAEVDNTYIRTYGENYIHISDIDYFVEYTPDEPLPLFRMADELKELKATEETKRIAELVSTLIRDGDTIQVGWSMNTMLFPWLGVFDNKKDLGWYSELTPPGITTLIKEGVFTGKRKTLHPGKVISTCLFGSSEEKSFYANNPMFELRSVSYTNHPRNIAANDNMVPINGALMVDLSGQIGNEVLPDGYVWNALPGQPEWIIGALMSKGGRSIHCLNSANKERSVSRIVPQIPEGIPVTIPRYFADIIVTEYGIAHLLGKPFRERAEELINIAHPDFRAKLRKAAQKLFW